MLKNSIPSSVPKFTIVSHTISIIYVRFVCKINAFSLYVTKNYWTETNYYSNEKINEDGMSVCYVFEFLDFDRDKRMDSSKTICPNPSMPGA